MTPEEALEQSRRDWPGFDAGRILSCPRWQDAERAGDRATMERMIAEAIRAEVAQTFAECAAICDRIQAEAKDPDERCNGAWMAAQVIRACARLQSPAGGD